MSDYVRITRITAREIPPFVKKHHWECLRQDRSSLREFEQFWEALNTRERSAYLEDIDPALERLHEILHPATTGDVLNFWVKLKRRERRYFVALVKQQKRS